MEEFEIPKVFSGNKRTRIQRICFSSPKVRIKEYSICLSTVSRPQPIDSSRLVISTLLCKKWKCEISTEQKSDASNTEKQLLLYLNIMKRKVDFSY